MEQQVPRRGALTSGVTALQCVDKNKKMQARNLRRNGTPSEKILWERLRNRQVDSLKFRRQQVIEGFIADFFCEKVKLVVEVDGHIHDEEKQQRIDEHRDKVFNARGLYVLRFKNDDVIITPAIKYA